MAMDQKQQFRDIVTGQESLTRDASAYWSAYSGFDTWQFWVIAGMLLIPLIVVYKFIRRDMIFRIGFFGFTVHVLFAYTDTVGIRYALWGYPYQAMPALPSLSLDASLIPAAIMLIYQWCVTRRRSFHLYALITAGVFGYGLKPVLTAIDLFEPYKWVNYFYIFLIYIVLFELAYWLTKLFLLMQERAEHPVIHARRR